MKTLYRRNETSVPAVSTPASTKRPPCHSTTATPLNNANVITPTKTPRTSARRTATRTTSLILRPYRAPSHVSCTKLCTVRIWVKARYGRKMSDVVRVAVRRALVRGVFVGVITFALFSGVAVVLWQGGRLVLAGVLTAGTLVSFLLYSVFIAAAVGALTSLFSSYQETVG